MPLEYYLTLGFILFFIGVFGVLSRRNAFSVFMSIELMLNAVNLIFAAFASFKACLAGYALVMIVIAIAASEVAFGLGLIILMQRSHKSIELDLFSSLREKQ
ncbi:MAG: NADH-quinone oxidoreductase subunit NuoK [Deltaproteobacteria bacterium]|nr:MAG: NADH-quinone oxidoreductase subunit NuoK [Deltaproteobacteria bacterium]